MSICFVIQPFDKGKFDKRYLDVFKPAIEKTKLLPYRVDKDSSVRIPIETIESKIKQSELCFADITLDNPNVWYELGYAFACNKDVVLICSDERKTDFPFDIRHKHIITYLTDSPKDFEVLGESITNKINAYLEGKNNLHIQSKVNLTLNKSDNVELKNYEVHLLKILIEAQPTNCSFILIEHLKDAFKLIGYTDYLFSLGLRNLCNKQYIQCSVQTDDWNHPYNVCSISEIGEAWIFLNLNHHPILNTIGYDDDSLPF